MANTKMQAAKLIASGRGFETFHHQTLGAFNVSALREIVQRVKHKMVLHVCPFDKLGMVDNKDVDAFEYLTANREIDLERCAQFTDRQLKEPLLFLLCPPGTNGTGESHLLIDGIHRLYERKRRGKTLFKFYLFPLELAPVIRPGQFREVPWGEKDLVPGVGLVKRKE